MLVFPVYKIQFMNMLFLTNPNTTAAFREKKRKSQLLLPYLQFSFWADNIVLKTEQKRILQGDSDWSILLHAAVRSDVTRRPTYTLPQRFTYISSYWG